MPSQSVQKRISLLIKAKKRDKDLGVREAARAAKISPATFSRLERGLATTLPDVATLEKLSRWLGVSFDHLFGESTDIQNSTPASTTPELVEVHLRADKNIDPDAAKALAEMFKTLYAHAAKKPAQ